MTRPSGKIKKICTPFSILKRSCPSCGDMRGVTIGVAAVGEGTSSRAPAGGVGDRGAGLGSETRGVCSSVGRIG